MTYFANFRRTVRRHNLAGVAFAAFLGTVVGVQLGIRQGRELSRLQVEASLSRERISHRLALECAQLHLSDEAETVMDALAEGSR